MATNTETNTGIRRHIPNKGERNFEPGESYICTHQGMVINGTTLNAGDAIPAGVPNTTLEMWFNAGMIEPAT